MENLEFEMILISIVVMIVCTAIFWSIGAYFFKVPQILRELEKINNKGENPLSKKTRITYENKDEVEARESTITESQRKVWDEIQKGN